MCLNYFSVFPHENLIVVNGRKIVRRKFFYSRENKKIHSQNFVNSVHMRENELNDVEKLFSQRKNDELVVSLVYHAWAEAASLQTK